MTDELEGDGDGREKIISPSSSSHSDGDLKLELAKEKTLRKKSPSSKFKASEESKCVVQNSSILLDVFYTEEGWKVGKYPLYPGSHFSTVWGNEESCLRTMMSITEQLKTVRESCKENDDVSLNMH